jgi:NAD(P)H-dependent FMN reductase
MVGRMNILAISGSLRAASLNSALLRTAQRLAPDGVDIQLCTFVGDLPLFNPDLQDMPPMSVMALQMQVAAADALLIASPEYAHGVTGAVKNLLDWLVSFEPFVNKPVAVLNASPRAHHADAALRETLRTMSAALVEPASLSIPLLGSSLGEADMADAPVVVAAIQTCLTELQIAVARAKQNVGPAFSIR